ncbi:MAG: hypothetical protein L0387_16150, partial [Acidobacteria bacterium]|nr:hypothetical protein [Acidobacteriota bacterium]MCI0724837.1 hypothetical protein [Acidobacteriota bacterium]
SAKTGRTTPAQAAPAPAPPQPRRGAKMSNLQGKTEPFRTSGGRAARRLEVFSQLQAPLAVVPATL